MLRPFTVQQACAARAFLGWSKSDLSEASGLSMTTIKNFENASHLATLEVFSFMRIAFQTAGVEFLSGSVNGVLVVVQTNPWEDT